MKSFNLFLILFLATTAFSSCMSEKVKGSGNTITEVRELSGFDKVEIKGVITTNISYAEDFSVAVHTDEVAISKVLTSVSNNTLVIDLKGMNNYKDITFAVDVTMPTIQRIEHRGVSDSKLTGFNGLPTLEVIHKGVGDLVLKGSADQLTVDHDGVGELHAFGFEATSCEIDFDGVGNTEVTVREELKGKLTGVGNIRYKGNPTVTIKDTGVGNVNDAN